jgi:hypothetical protein
MLSNILLNSMLNKVVRLILDNPMHKVAEQVAPALGVLLELPPLLALQYVLLVQAQIIDAEFFKVTGIVSVGNHQDWKDVAAIHEFFNIFGAYLLKP